MSTITFATLKQKIKDKTDDLWEIKDETEHLFLLGHREDKNLNREFFFHEPLSQQLNGLVYRYRTFTPDETMIEEYCLVMPYEEEMVEIMMRTFNYGTFRFGKVKYRVLDYQWNAAGYPSLPSNLEASADAFRTAVMELPAFRLHVITGNYDG